MKKPNDIQKLIDKFAAASESGRINGDWADVLGEEPWNRFEDWAQSLSEVAGAVDAAIVAIDGWRYAEDRDEKREAKEEAMGALEELVVVFNASPLDLASMDDWVPEEE